MRGHKAVFSVLFCSIVLALFSASFVFAQSGNAPNNVNWTNFDFSGAPYASNGAGKFDKFGPCGFRQEGGPVLCMANNTYDLISTWIDQDQNTVAFKITANNFSNAAFCNGTQNLSLWIEFDADSSITRGMGSLQGVTGCGNISGYNEACMPGADYQIEVNKSGFGVFKTYSGTNPQCSLGVEGTCFNHTPGIPVYVNISRIGDNVSGPGCSSPYEVKISILKKNLTWSVFTYSAASFNSSTGEPIDSIGEASGENFGTEDFMHFEGSQGFMFKEGGCFTINNQSGCTNTSQNGNFSCSWNSQFGRCEMNFADSTTYGCSQFCGACTSQSDCGTGAKGTCQWSGSFCMEDFSKIRSGGNCDENCFDCFSQSSCDQSSVSGGCKFVTDTATQHSFCAEKGFTMMACGYNSENSSCGACQYRELCTSGNSSGFCAWENAGEFCYSNETDYEICFNSKDDNNDGKIDCADPKCSAEKFCGSEFEKKLMTDKVFVTTLKSAGICTQTATALDCNKEAMMGFEFAKNMKPGPPIELAFDGPDGQLALDKPHLDIMGFGFKDMGSAYGLGIALVSTQNLLPCSPSAGQGGYYIYYIDTDANPTTGCVANISGINITGVEYKILYNISTNGSQRSTLNETRKAYRCVKNQSSTFGQFPASLGVPKDPTPGAQQPLCSFGAAVTVVKLNDIGNPSSNFVFSVASFMNTSIDTNATDYIINASYTPGTVEYRPDDCVSNPFACGSAFSQLGKGKFMPFEDCLQGTGDEDMDGTSNCDDTDCLMAPWCGYNRESLIGNDKTAPKTKVLEVKSFGTVAFLTMSTDEPTNMTVFFYNTSSSCATQVVNVTGTRSKFGSDNHMPWHDLPFDTFALNESGSLAAGVTPLASSKTYFYKVKTCDLAGNCGTSACLNFTTGSASSNSIKFGFEFDAPQGNSLLSGITIDFHNGTGFTPLTPGSLINITVTSNATLRLKSTNSTIGNNSEPWILELRGADLAKATMINLTGSLIIKNDSTGDPYIGMNGTKWQEIAQVLGVDSIRLNISDGGDRLVKCDENLNGCQDITGNATKAEGNSNYSIWDIPTYGMGGFSTYSSERINVSMSSDRTIYQCYPYCTAYFNLTVRNDTLTSTSETQSLMTLTLNNTVFSTSSSDVMFNISWWNFSTQDWQVIGFNTNNTVIANYNFKLYNGSNPSNSTHQFKIVINQTTPAGVKWIFTVNVSNGTFPNENITTNFSDVAYLDSINLSILNNNNITSNITPDFRFTLFSYNSTVQNCTLYINGTPLGRNDSVVNASPVSIKANASQLNGYHQWNVSCVSNLTGEYGYSLTRNFSISESNPPIISNVTNGSIDSDSAVVSWLTDEPSNSTISYGTSNTSLDSQSVSTAYLSTHSITLSLSASTTYYYNVTSCDNGGTCNMSGPYTFATSAAPSTPSASSSGGGSGGGGGGGGAVTPTGLSAAKVWSELPKGATVMKVSNVEIGLRELTIDVKNSRTSVEIKVTKLESKPSAVTAPAASVYQYIQVDKTNLLESDINKATVKFRVAKDWLTENKVSSGNIVLLRYVSGWTELKTSVTSSDQLYYYYQAESPGLSVFAISGKESAPPVQNATTQDVVEESAASKANETTEASPVGDVVAEPPVSSEKKGFSFTKEIILAIVGLIVIIAGVIGFFMFKKRQAGGGTS